MKPYPENLQAFNDAVSEERLHAMKQIGNTPLEPVYLVIQNKARKIHLKLEGYNPTGSMKARTACALLQQVASQQPRGPKSTIVESTSGNLGVALAFFCRAYHYQFLAVVDPKTTAENLQRLQALGAQVEMVDQPDSTGSYLLSRLSRVEEICQSHPEYVRINQYTNAANPLIHYMATAPEIYHQMHEQVEVVFIPVSTGGTLAGVGRYFREKSPATKIIGVDAYGSVVFGTPSAPRKLTGIGSSRPSSFLTPDLYDTYMLARDAEAFAFCRALEKATSHKTGGSSGAVIAACARYLQEHPEAKHVVCICADRGENYASSIYNDQWLEQQGFSLTDASLGPVQAVLPAHAISL